MKTEYPIKFDLSDVPADVIWVWSVEAMCTHVGSAMYQKMNNIVKANPMYFPWEHKYDSIPDEVHKAFNDEAYSDTFQWIEAGKDIEPGVGLMQQLVNESNKVVPYVPIQGEVEYEKVWTEFIQREIDRRKQREEREAELERIWNKHYRKYKLKYRSRNK
jgi:hypothetical protein